MPYAAQHGDCLIKSLCVFIQAILCFLNEKSSGVLLLVYLFWYDIEWQYMNRWKCVAEC